MVAEGRGSMRNDEDQWVSMRIDEVVVEFKFLSDSDTGNEPPRANPAACARVVLFLSHQT